MGFHTIDKAKKPVPQKSTTVPTKPLPVPEEPPCVYDPDYPEDCPLSEPAVPPHKIFGINPIAFLSTMAVLSIGSFSFMFFVLFCFYVFIVKSKCSKIGDKPNTKTTFNQEENADSVTLIILE